MSRYFTKTLAALEPYVPGEQLKIDDLVKLNANENPYPPAPGVAAAVAAAVPGLRLYSDLSNRALNEAIAAHWGVQPENILCGNGSDENLLLALRAFCDENTPLAFADVTYSFYPVLCDLLHIPQHVIPLEDDLTIDLKKYCGLHETIVIANPNAPTSLLAPVAAIEEVLRTNPDNIVVVDETYVEFAPAGSSCLPLLEKYENLVITHFLQDPQPGGRAAGLLHRQAGADHRHEPRQVQLQSLQRQLDDPGRGYGRHPGRGLLPRGDRQAAGHPHRRHRRPAPARFYRV